MNIFSIHSIELENFQGVKHLQVDMKGKSINIYGDNGTFKTTLANAISWVLFGKDSHGQANFDIKTIVDGIPVSGLEHRATITFGVDGKKTTLSKLFKEKWTKKRGESTPTFTGNVNEYFVDGVPVKEKEFKERCSEITTEDKFRLLTQPDFFASTMPWVDRRNILMEMVSQKSDLVLIWENPDFTELAEIPEIAEGRSIEDHVRTISSRKAAINKELTIIPGKIQENERDMPSNPGGFDLETLTGQLAQANTYLDSINAKIARAETGANDKLYDDLAAAKLAHSEFKVKWNNTESEELKTLRAKEAEILSEVSSLKRRHENNQSLLKSYQDENKQIQEKIAALKADFSGPEFSPNPGMTCDSCSQEIPVELQAAAHKTMIRQHRDRINAQGKELTKKANELRQKSDELMSWVQQVGQELGDLTAKHEAVLIQIKNRPSFDNDETAQRLALAIDEINAKIQEGPAAGAGNDDLQQEKEAATKRAAELQEQINSLKAAQKVKDRTAELKEQQRTLGIEFDAIENVLFLVEKFMKYKAMLLDELVSARFEITRFRLFKEQINGGIAPSCDVLGPGGVPYSTGLNNGARINVGIDILNTLGAHYGLRLPIVIDNAESVTKLHHTEAQVIRLIVSEADKSLRFETI